MHIKLFVSRLYWKKTSVCISLRLSLLYEVQSFTISLTKKKKEKLFTLCYYWLFEVQSSTISLANKKKREIVHSKLLELQNNDIERMVPLKKIDIFGVCQIKEKGNDHSKFSFYTLAYIRIKYP
jgi:hypothetical protein